MGIRIGIAQMSLGSAMDRDIERMSAGTDQGSQALGYAADDSALPPSLATATAQAEDQRLTGPVFDPDFGPFAVWSGGFVNFGERDSGGLDLNHTMVGISGSIDYRFRDHFVGGFGVGYGRDRTDIWSNGSESSSTAVSGALYGSYNPIDNLFIDGLIGASSMDFRSLRFVTATGDYAPGQRSGSQIFGALIAAYEFRDDNWLISPYGRLEASRCWLNGFTEDGGSMYGLTYGDQTSDTLSGVIGIRANYRFDTEIGVLTPSIRAEYAHDFAGSSRATIGYSNIGTLPFAIETDPTTRDHLRLWTH